MGLIVTCLELQKNSSGDYIHGLNEVSDTLDNLSDRYRIDYLCWKDFPYRPEVSFKISYSRAEIYLKFYVREKYFKAEMTEINQPVWEDSCVEFFVSPAGDGIYYNFEFNGIGTCYMGCGTGRHDSMPAPVDYVSRIRTLSSMGKKPFKEIQGDIYWELVAAIPVSVFFRHRIIFSAGRMMRGNFYKCGDRLTEPHYLAWRPVLTGKPDFHRPEYFDELQFS
ncbi:MAG: hypothetical protein GYA43_00525 [Bacteroidales bacterium]|nr:hypothetical protein [Bacteroidales bacterium]